MSFQDAENANATLAGLSALLRDALKVASYVANIYQVYDNKDTDTLIPAVPKAGEPTSRKDLLQEVSRHRGDPSLMPNEAVQFCRLRLLQGPPYPGADKATFGRVQALESLANAIVSPLRGMTLRQAKALLEDDIRGGDPGTRFARQKMDLADYELSRFPMWCFPVADSTQPFAEIGSTRSDAVNALGLGHYSVKDPTAELVRWSHGVPPTIEPKKPTAWDAGASPENVYWRPGGKTLPLTGSASGITEVVHNPIKGANLIKPIEALS